MINSPMVKKLIEDNKVGQITKVMEDSASFYKMQTFNLALFNLVKEGKISAEEALAISDNTNDLKIRFQIQGVDLASTAAEPPELAAGV